MQVQLPPRRGQQRALELDLRVAGQPVDELGKRRQRRGAHALGGGAAHGARRLAGVGECIGEDLVVPQVHHVVGEHRVDAGGELERLVAARGGDDGVGGSDRRDDVLDHAEGEAAGDALDAKERRALKGGAVHPIHVVGVVAVELGVGKVAAPLQLAGPLDAVLGEPRRVGDGAHGVGGVGAQHVQQTLVAQREGGDDDARLPAEPLGAAVNHRHHVGIGQPDQGGVDPPPRLHAVEPADHHLELRVVRRRLVLDAAKVRRDGEPRVVAHAPPDKLGRHLGLGPPNVALAKQKLPIEVGHVDGVHVDHLDVLKPGEGKILENLAPEPAGANHEDAAAAERLRRLLRPVLLGELVEGPDPKHRRHQATSMQEARCARIIR